MAPKGDGLGMNPEPLHAAGGAIAGLKSDAASAKTKFLGAIQDGSGAVHHAKLKAALDKYHTTWAKPAGQLPTAVESVGNKIKATAVDGVQTDAQSRSDVTHGQSPGDHTVLKRPITVGR